MKRYIRANIEKPVLDFVDTSWEELEDGSGVLFIIRDNDANTLFEQLFDYTDVDSDDMYDSSMEMAILALSQKYDLTDEVIETIKGN